MKLFYTNASAKEEISNLESRISVLVADSTTAAMEISRLTEELENSSESLAAMNTELDEAVSAFEKADKDLKDANAKLATAMAKLDKYDDDIEAAAQAKFAGLGGPPIASGVEGQCEVNKMKRTDFNAMSAIDRNKFIREGGKLTD